MIHNKTIKMILAKAPRNNHNPNNSSNNRSNSNNNNNTTTAATTATTAAAKPKLTSTRSTITRDVIKATKQPTSTR